jgi:beta-N-acetylhexosaminidase
MIKKLLLTALLSTILFAEQNTYTKEQIEKMIGKMVVLGFKGETAQSSSKIYKDIKKYDLGGVILFDKDPNNKKKIKNIRNPKQLQSLTKQLQSINKSKLLISIDQEGGIVQRLNKKNGFISIPKAKVVSTKGISYAKGIYSDLGKVLNTAGLNVNFAPVVDLNINPDNTVIVKLGRSFGKNPKKVTEYASIFINELKKENVISVLKHFPGHGSSLSDSHKGFVDISNTWSQKELDPYKYLIKNDKVDMIMTAHVFNKFLDPKYPATLSKNINTKLLRNKLKYKGVLVTDDLQMYAISKHYTLKQTVTLAINSGVDLLLFANQLAKPLKVEEIINTIYKQIENKEISIKTIVEANKRINSMLVKY